MQLGVNGLYDFNPCNRGTAVGGFRTAGCLMLKIFLDVKQSKEPPGLGLVCGKSINCNFVYVHH